MDPATGLTYMQQRYYDPAVGRFLSVDPVTASSINGGNFNRYWYAANNPYRYYDPDGRKNKSTLKRSICDDQPTRCQGGGASAGGEGASIDGGLRSTTGSGGGAPTARAMPLTVENAGDRLALAEAELDDRIQAILMFSFHTELEAAEWFVSLTQDMTTAWGVEFGAVIVDENGSFSIGNVSPGRVLGSYNVWDSAVSPSPGGGLAFSNIHTHPIPGATNGFWHSPFSPSDMLYYGTDIRGLVSLPNGAIYATDPGGQPERIK